MRKRVPFSVKPSNLKKRGGCTKAPTRSCGEINDGVAHYGVLGQRTRAVMPPLTNERSSPSFLDWTCSIGKILPRLLCFCVAGGNWWNHPRLTNKHGGGRGSQAQKESEFLRDLAEVVDRVLSHQLTATYTSVPSLVGASKAAEGGADGGRGGARWGSYVSAPEMATSCSVGGRDVHARCCVTRFSNRSARSEVEVKSQRIKLSYVLALCLLRLTNHVQTSAPVHRKRPHGRCWHGVLCDCTHRQQT
jgi:hypothetical protein